MVDSAIEYVTDAGERVAVVGVGSNKQRISCRYPTQIKKVCEKMGVVYREDIGYSGRTLNSGGGYELDQY